jgi:hypothetical protein
MSPLTADPHKIATSVLLMSDFSISIERRGCPPFEVSSRRFCIAPPLLPVIVDLRRTTF